MLLRWLAGEHAEELDDSERLMFIGASVGLVLLSGLMSGLVLGLMSLDMVDLEVLKRSGTEVQKKCAAKIAPIIKNPHWLLVTLQLVNAGTMEALPLCIDRLADPITAVLVSVSVVVIFGEILPQAICSKYGLQVGASASWFVRFLMFICAPIAYPISKVLDWVLGPNHTALFRRNQLKAFVEVHGSSGHLSPGEVGIIQGAIDLTSKDALHAMTPLDQVFMISVDDVVDEPTLDRMLATGHSRIPVYANGNRTDIIGVILVKELVRINPAQRVSVAQLKIRELPRIEADAAMYDALTMFQNSRSQMAVVTRPASMAGDAAATAPSTSDARSKSVRSHNGKPETEPLLPHSASSRDSHQHDQEAPAVPRKQKPAIPAGPAGAPVGVITVEDVIEELLMVDFYDEDDHVEGEAEAPAAARLHKQQSMKLAVTAGLFAARAGGASRRVREGQQ